MYISLHIRFYQLRGYENEFSRVYRSVDTVMIWIGYTCVFAYG